MALTAKDIHVIRIIIREEVRRCSNLPSAVATVNPNAVYAAGYSNEPVYLVGQLPAMSESEYNEYLSRLSQD